MKVEWTQHAVRQRDLVAEYIRLSFGAKRKDLFLKKVRQTVKMLKHNPNIGPIDPLFDDRPSTYRSIIINGLNKLVYRTDADTIYIVAFWDTRSEPEQQASEV